MTLTPATGAAAELPITAWESWNKYTGDCWGPLTPQAPAQAQLDALREEVARLTKERRQLEFAMGAWKEMFWAVARELNCLPSTFWDGNAHVLKAAIKLNAELATLKTQHDRDMEAVEWCTAGAQAIIAERDALRTALAARKEEL